MTTQSKNKENEYSLAELLTNDDIQAIRRPIVRRWIFQKLVTLALSQKTISYRELAIEFGFPTTWPELPRSLAPILLDIYNWCEEKGWPKLTVLVVRKGGTDSGIPGPGFWKAYDGSDKKYTTAEKRDMFDVLSHEVFEYFSNLTN